MIESEGSDSGFIGFGDEYQVLVSGVRFWVQGLRDGDPGLGGRILNGESRV